MEIIETGIEGLLILKPRIFEDPRGYFFESYNKDKFAALGIHNEFIQDNQSKSSRGVVRGLHCQTKPYSQAKLVRCLQGAVLDVAVDIRKGSPTYGKHFTIELSEENQTMFMIPRGFLHGFSVLSETAVFQYKCDNPYHPESERGIDPYDKELNIDWGFTKEEAVLSSKDVDAPAFSTVEPI
jgi:dTDP-4-dehydrorhamnose 3,5-epimerase